MGSSAGSQGEGGPGEKELSVANATAAFEMVLSPGAGIASAARAQPRGCKGRSPLHKKTKNLPLPRRGRGLGGWGKKRKVKAGAAGGKAGKPPSGFRKGRVIRRPPGQALRRVPQWQGQPVPPGFSPGDARGEAPCIRKLKNPPLPRRGRGLGGWGQKSYDTAGKAGAAGHSAPRRVNAAAG